MKIKKGSSIAILGILIAIMIISILLPAKALFTGDGYVVPFLGFTEVHKMFIEILCLFLIFGGLFLIKIDGRIRIFLIAVGFLFFCWIHVTFLPMIGSGIYLLFLLLSGHFLRIQVFRMKKRGGWPADFILGCSFTITIFCIMGLFRIKEIPVFRITAIILGVLFLVWYFVKLYRSGYNPFDIWTHLGQSLDSAPFCIRLGLTFILVIVLIQIGRVNLAMDFDTLWYGVRSEYIITCGEGIYDNPGMVSLVYAYSKGWEILTLPLCDQPSHTYLNFFHIWLAILGLLETKRIANLFMNKKGAFLSIVLTAAIPGIMNMSVSAKTDMITWFIQLIMIELFFTYVKETNHKKRRPVSLLILTAGAYLLSLTMKPTSLVFSTAVFGMMGIYLLFSKRLAVRAPITHWLGLIFPITTLILVWMRTYFITGMPVTSIFTSIFEKLGFTLKYPYATSDIPSNYNYLEGETTLQMFFRRLYQMLLSPAGDDMLHISMAWGSSLILFIAVFVLLSKLNLGFLQRDSRERASYSVRTASKFIFWPFLVVNLISLIMLYQIDGNYFMLLYSMIVLIGCQHYAELRHKAGRIIILLCMIPFFLLNTVVSATTCWAWSSGFTPIQLKNSGYYDHEAQSKGWFENLGVNEIWNFLEQDKEYRVISFGEHPNCLQFPCVVQSYKDITSPWGNVEIVNTVEAFEEYMEYSGTDYVYAQAGFLGDENWSWSYGLLRDMIKRGTIDNFMLENGNFLGRRTEVPVSQEQAAENLRLFDEQYRTFGTP